MKSCILMTLLVFLLVACRTGADPDTTPPGNDAGNPGLSVTLTATPTEGQAPLRVQFAANTGDDRSTPLSYTWKVAGRTFEGSRRHSHIFAQAGTFPVAVTVSNGEGTASADATIAVSAPQREPGNVTPTVLLTAVPTEGEAPLAVTFTADADDPDDDFVSYLWDYGDGSTEVGGRVRRHSYAEQGQYNATATVSDGNGGVTSSSVTVAVAGEGGGEPVPGGVPVIRSFTASPRSVGPGEQVTLSWDVNGATSLALSPKVGVVTGTSRTVFPLVTTDYTLTASNAEGQDSATVTVTVGEAPPPEEAELPLEFRGYWTWTVSDPEADTDLFKGVLNITEAYSDGAGEVGGQGVWRWCQGGVNPCEAAESGPGRLFYGPNGDLSVVGETETVGQSFQMIAVDHNNLLEVVEGALTFSGPGRWVVAGEGSDVQVTMRRERETPE